MKIELCFSTILTYHHTGPREKACTSESTVDSSLDWRSHIRRGVPYSSVPVKLYCSYIPILRDDLFLFRHGVCLLRYFLQCCDNFDSRILGIRRQNNYCHTLSHPMCTGGCHFSWLRIGYFYIILLS